MSEDKFTSEIRTLHHAGVGVMMVRSKEPLRAIASLQRFADSQSLPFKAWNFRDGWVTPTSDPYHPEKDKMIDPFGATKRIMDLDGGGESAFPDGIYVMAGLNPILEKVPGLLWCLRDYVSRFAETHRRLILLMPSGYVLPQEIQQEIPVVDFELPTQDELDKVLGEVLEASFDEGETFVNPYEDEDRRAILTAAAGLTVGEAEIAFSKAIVENPDTWPETPMPTFRQVVMRAKTEAVKRSEVLELMKSESIENVGGLEALKDWLTLTKEAFTAEAREYGLDMPKGMMVVGPPGTGKSLVGKATSAIFGLPFIRVDIGRFMAGIVGQSEERVRNAMAMLDAMAPCVAFVDEVDKGLGGAHQAGGDSGVTRRILGTILTHMQESQTGIFWIFTANRTDSLPSELVRKGRLDETWSIGAPNDAEREAIIQIHLRKRGHDPDSVGDLDAAIGASEGYMGAEIEAAVKEAIKHSFHSKSDLTGAGIAEQFAYMTPMAKAFAADFAAQAAWAAANARPASVPDDYDEPKKARARRRKLN